MNKSHLIIGYPQNVFLNKAYAIVEGTCERPYTCVTDIWGQTQQKTSAALTWEPPPSSPLLPHTAMYALTVTKKIEIAIKLTVLLIELASTFHEPTIRDLTRSFTVLWTKETSLHIHGGLRISAEDTNLNYGLEPPSGNGGVMLKLLMAVCGMWGPTQLGYCTRSLSSSGWSKKIRSGRTLTTLLRCHFPHPKLNARRLSQGLKAQSLFLQHQRKC